MARAAVLEALDKDHPQVIDQIKRSVTLSYRDRTPEIVSSSSLTGKSKTTATAPTPERTDRGPFAV